MIPISNRFCKNNLSNAARRNRQLAFPGPSNGKLALFRVARNSLLALAITRITPQDEAWRRLSQILKNVIASNVDATVKLYTVSRTYRLIATNIFYLET